MSRSGICFIGEPILDHYIPLQFWPGIGDKATFTSYSSTPGGAVANATIACRALGGECTLVGRLSDGGAGRELQQDLAAHGVGVDTLRLEPGPVDPVCFVFLVGQSNVVVYPDRSAEQYELDADMLAAIGRAAVVVSTTEKLERMSNADELLRVLRESSADGARLVLDLDNGHEVRGDQRFLGIAACVIMNEFGAGRLLGPDPAGYRARATELGIQQDAVLIVTLAADGLWVGHDTEAYVPGIPVEAIDPTGAGDAFVGALAFALERGMAPQEAAALANRLGAYATTVSGPRVTAPLPDWVTVREPI